MAKTGSINDEISVEMADNVILLHTGRKTHNTEKGAQRGFIMLLDAVSAIKALFISARNIKAPDLIWQAEYALLSQEYERRDTDNRLIGSGLEAQMSAATDAFRSLEVMTGGNYKDVDKAYTSKGSFYRVKGGLPRDAFHNSCAHNIKSLKHLIAPSTNEVERALIMQRIENLETARDVYMVMQREALGRSK
ncbi:hypothetical protein RsTz2092_06410 [Deferribacterales bacterium RsTz2092]|nr:hypothetical protein AGMMS49941_06550 [Deferribacterales bacterium]